MLSYTVGEIDGVEKSGRETWIWRGHDVGSGGEMPTALAASPLHSFTTTSRIRARLPTLANKHAFTPAAIVQEIGLEIGFEIGLTLVNGRSSSVMRRSLLDV